MIWKFDFPPGTLVWLLAVTLAVGMGWRGYEWLTNRRAVFPFAVVRDESAVRAIRATVDSVLQVRRAALQSPVPINTADARQFESLDGIGAVLAARIIEHRREHGPFGSLDDLLQVPGIGPKRLEAIRARCVVDSLPMR